MSHAVLITAIAAIGGLDALAISKGIDGWLFLTTISSIFTIAGYAVGKHGSKKN